MIFLRMSCLGKIRLGHWHLLPIFKLPELHWDKLIWVFLDQSRLHSWATLPPAFPSCSALLTWLLSQVTFPVPCHTREALGLGECRLVYRRMSHITLHTGVLHCKMLKGDNIKYLVSQGFADWFPSNIHKLCSSHSSYYSHLQADKVR